MSWGTIKIQPVTHKSWRSAFLNVILLAFYCPMKTKKNMNISPKMLHALLAIDVTFLHVLLSIFNLCACSLKFNVWKRDIRRKPLRYHTNHSTSWCHRFAFAWPPGVLYEHFTSSCGLRVKCWRHTMSTRLLPEGVMKLCCRPYRISYFVCLSCYPRVRFGSRSSRFLRLKIILLTSSGVTLRKI